VAFSVSPELLAKAKERQRYILQTDLWELANLLYPPPESYWSEKVHRPICNFFVKKQPGLTIAQQDTRKQRLLLDPRNHFKTTMDIVDIVQWILCFPDVRVLIASGTRDNAIKMLRAVKSHFQYNAELRYFFPELCPEAHKNEDFGTQDGFICPGRTKRYLREPTCSVASPDSTVAGMHYDILKFDDLVNETNSRTAEGIKQVNQWYKLTNPLLEPYGYRDVIGTRYDYSDLYGEILGNDADYTDFVGRDVRGYLVSLRSCFLPDGTPLFAERFTTKRLESERDEMGSFLFSCQYLNRPIPSDSQYFTWPTVERSLIKRDKLPPNRTYFTAFDLAMSQNDDADHTAIITCGIARPEGSRNYHIYIEHIDAGHYKPLDVVRRLFDIHKQFIPVQLRTEEVGFQRLLEPIILAESARQGRYLPLVWIPRDNREAKQARIAGLQPWFERNEIHIVDDILNKELLILELVRFPKYRRDDVADALADILAVMPMFSGQVAEPLQELSDMSGDPQLGYLA